MSHSTTQLRELPWRSFCKPWCLAFSKAGFIMCDRAYALENGRIVREGSGEDLISDEHVREAYLGI